MKPRSDDKYYEINIYTTGLLRTQHNMWKKPCDIQLTTLLLVTHVILHLGLEYLKLFSYYTTLKHHFLKHFRVVLETYKMFAWHEMAVSVLWCEKYLKNTSLVVYMYQSTNGISDSTVWWMFQKSIKLVVVLLMLQLLGKKLKDK